MPAKQALVVDNDFFFVEFLGELLEKREFQVTKAYNGKEGLLKLENGPFDVIFADLIMPKIDGIQLIKIARTKFRDVPFFIIAISGSIVEQMDELGETEVDWFVAKGPLDEMETQINAILDQINQAGGPRKDRNRFVEPGVLHPRQVTGELIDTLNFQKGVIESIGFGIVVVDKDARVINATSRALELLNRSPEDILNKHITSFFPKEERAYLIDALKAVVRNQALPRVRIAILTDAKTLRLTVSLLKVGREIMGWVIAIEEPADE
ncbi:MAG: hypothetical protein B5M55_00580 [Desulfococcus sp. 4484_242]|nr:MAG: hypothetical protein B5M55_00580 [Desulfococcus sp. 4484_242]